MYIIRTKCLDLKKNWLSRAAQIQWKLCTLYVRNVYNCRKTECQNCGNSTGNWVSCICTECLDLQKKLNIQNSKNSTRNCIHYICKERLDLQKNWMSRTAEIQREIMYVICTECLNLQKNWISRTLKIQLEIVYIIYVWHV